jgi:taurine dioxygenase
MTDDLSAETVAEIRAALLQWKVIFFRDQHALDRAAHIAFGRRFGDLEIHPKTPEGVENPEVLVIPAGGKRRAPDVWHSDVTWRPEPSMGSILRAVELPPLGGDTLWADMAAAYDALDDDFKERVDELVALHDYAANFGRGQSLEVQERMRQENPTVEHPVIRTHPESGRKAIFVNGGFTIGIKGMTDDEAKPILNRLQQQAKVVDFQCRFRWALGSVAFWDNRATQHCVSNDFLPATRIMERVTVVGDRPYR